MNNQITNYFDEIENNVSSVYKIAGKARNLGFDPEDEVNIPLAKNMAERVEGLIGASIPEIIGSGLSKRVQEIEKKYGKLDLRTALAISLETVQEKFCKFENKIKAMEAGIRVGLAYLTMGVVSSPLEGFVELKLKKRADGKEYLCLMYSGPIRSAGGTAGALSVVIADYIRKKTGYDVYDPTEKETKRIVTELYDYHERVTNLQYLPSEKEIKFLVKNLPVQISGDASEKIEVSNYKDLDRIETNKIRSGPCLVFGECLAQKASKVWNILSRGVDGFELEHWSFLEQFLSLQKKVKARDEITKGKILPVYTFIQDLVAGRPILTHPLAAGGFRLRYGRSRTTGYSSTAIHPSTMHILNKYLATGTQLKLERPGKATAITVCDSIEGPIVKLEDDSVLRLDDETLAKKSAKDIKEILFLGDILISYGDFYNRAHTLLPPGYCEEWWFLEVERATVDAFGTLDLDKLALLLETEKFFLEKLFKEPINTKPNAKEAFIISRKLKVPLHPKYTHHWNLISTEDFFYLFEHLTNSKISSIDNAVTKLVLDYDDSLKSILDKIGIPYLVTNKEFIVIEKDDAYTISEIFNLSSNRQDTVEIKSEETKSKDNLFLINQISDIKIKDKSGIFIGARMGRPEKAKMRKLKGSPHTLFPIGEEGGRLRSFQGAFENNKVTAEFPIFYCGKCKKQAIFNVCDACSKKTERRYNCNTCGLTNKEECKHGKTATYLSQSIDIKSLFDNYLKKLNIKTYPDLIKGVRGTSNKDHIPEHFIKGLFRAKYDIHVNRDGTSRYDMTQLPLTHFKPKEIKTPVEKLRELGYKKDIFGKELENKDQVLELFPQDIILPSCNESPELGADKILLKISFFIDDLLEQFYNLKKFYNFQSEEDLPGTLVAIIAPHTSAAVTGRIVGFSQTQGFFAHPMVHAATRRDCLGYDNYIPIKQNGSWKIEKIGAFIENIDPNEKADDFGTLRKKVSSVNTWSNPGQGDVVEITKHQPNQMLRLFLEDGRQIELTENHKVYVKSKKEKRAHELVEGDQVMVSYKKNIEEIDIEEIFLPEIFSNREDVMLRNIRDYLVKFEKLSKHDNFCWRDSFPIKFVQEFLSRHNKTLQDLPAGTRIAIRRDNVSLPIRIPLDKKLLEVIGLYIAEGYLRKNDSKKGFYQISISGNDDIKKFSKKIFYSHFNLKPSYENSDQVTFSSRLVYELFKSYLRTGNGAKNKRIPYLFLNLKKEKLAAFLRGYFEGDGSVSLSDIRVTCDTVSEGLKYDLSFVLSRFNIFTKFYEYEKKPGPKVRKFYIKKQKTIPSFKITKIIILSNFVKEFKQIGFISERKNRILHEICQRQPYGTRIDFDEQYGYPKILRIEQTNEKISYCLNVSSEHNFFANDILVHNCDGDEASIILLLDALLNFSKQYLPNTRGSTQDAPLVLTSKLIPAEVDDMAFDLDIGWKYPIEFYEACMDFKQPREVEIEQFGKRLDTDKQYSDFGFTHNISNINTGVRCSAYKILPSMEEKLRGQMELANKIRAVDEVDVARLVIEKHLIKDIRGNLRKFSMQQFRCSTCNEKYRRPPLVGKCLKCDGKIIFTISEGSIIKYLEPAISLADKYNLPDYLKQNLELTKRNVESLFGREKEKQEGLGKWFG
ncbi:DNA polymerase II large subunit [Candidatus Woesearchaeota archaeon]|nr:DNA polymerase II large subunit [Candidatus Woesearchaeota archaeon]|tara:strand:+ start:1235 stop:6127 length:4893 start_codon:yes stop_codon:yes gene_type:complete